MGLFQWLFKKKPNKYVFDDSDRESSKEIREKKKEIELLKLDRENEIHKLKIMKQKLELESEIQELQEAFSDDEDFYPEKESDSTTELIKMFAPMFINKAPVSAPIPTDKASNSSNPMEQKQHFTDEQIKAIWDNTPKMARMFAKKADEQTIKIQIQKQIPNIDDDSIARAIKLIKSS